MLCRWMIVALVAVLAVVAPRALGKGVLDPATYTSPSGEYELFVDPTNLEGAGPGFHELRRNGEVVWSDRLAFTLYEAVVTDDGIVGGYAYTAGSYGDRHEPGATSEMCVVSIDPTGGVRPLDCRVRTGNHWGYSYPTPPMLPRATGVVALAEADRFIVRVTARVGDTDDWWIHRFSDGARVADRTVGVLLDPNEAGQPRYRRQSEVAAIRLRGAPLVLTHWWYVGVGGSFTLHDADGREVWRLDIPDEYTELAAAGRHRSRWWNVFDEGVVQLESTVRGFAITSFAERSRIEYEVLRANETTGWSVVERAREAARPRSARADRGVPDLREVEIEHLGTTSLRFTEGREEPLHRVFVSHTGVIHGIGARAERVHVFASDGVQTRCIDLETGEDPAPGGRGFSVISDGSIFVTVDSRGPRSRLMRFDPRGRRVAMRRRDEDLWGVQPHGEPGWFWATSEDATELLDGQLRTIATVTHREDGRWLRVPGPGLAAPDGSLAILDTPHHPRNWAVHSEMTLHTYGPDGAATGTIDVTHTFPLGESYDPYVHRAAFDGRRAILSVAETHLVDIETGEITRCVFPEQAWLGRSLSIVGDELWSVSHNNTTIERFRLPD